MPVRVEHDMKKIIGELEEVVKVFKASPYILSKDGFMSDPFLIIKNLCIAEKDNLMAKVLLSSVKSLYRDFGTKAAVYFSFLEEMFEPAKKLMGSPDDLDKLLFMFASKSLQTVETDERMVFEQEGFSRIVLDAIQQANGEELSLKKGVQEVDLIEVESGFAVSIEPRTPKIYKGAKVLVLSETDTPNLAIEFAKRTKDPLVVVSTKRYPVLAEVEAKNPHLDFAYLVVRPEYQISDFILDIKAYVDQSLELSENTVLKTPSLLGSADFECDGTQMILHSRPTFMSKQRQKGIAIDMELENSPLRRMALQSRIANMSGSRTVIKVGAKTDTEAEAKLQKYFTEVVEISNILDSGIVSISEFDTNVQGYSLKCVTECFNRAMADLKLILSETRLIQS